MWADGCNIVLCRADDVQAELEARGLPLGMDEDESRAVLTDALLTEEQDPAAVVLLLPELCRRCRWSTHDLDDK